MTQPLFTNQVKFLFALALILCTYNISNPVVAEKIYTNDNLFYHGVASGDPLSDRVIIWTRLTVESPVAVNVKWIVAKDAQMSVVIKTGQLTTDASKDYTVKVDVTGLKPATVYYYQFKAENKTSVVGKTKTAPVGNPEKLAFAVVSCSNYAEGYFNALGKIAARNNLDAVIHLGDYIYEGTERNFDSRTVLTSEENGTAPANKEEWLAYYRKRYAVSHLDSNLKKAHQVHPFITVWDDHETADNAYKDGSYMHNPNEHGSWQERKTAAKQAYAEWMPIRGNASKIYRALKFGNLMELILVDTRLEGRDQQMKDASDSRLDDVNRTILGNEQRQWLLQKLKTSAATWKVIGNQVIFSDFNIGWAANAGVFADKLKQLEANLLDYWQGYPVEREQIIQYIKNHKINNVVVLSASMHCALAFDVKESGKSVNSIPYDPSTGRGSVAVEFATPSISSANFDEKVGSYFTSAFESGINTKLPLPFNYNPNPHMKFVDLHQHGYFILDITPKRAQASWYFVDTILKPESGEKMAARWYTQNQQNHLEKGAVEAE